MKGRLRKAEGLRGWGPRTAPMERTKREFIMEPAHHSAEGVWGARREEEDMKWM
jgi:hypothetical protein